MANAEEFDVDAIIDKLLEVRGARPGKEVNLPGGCDYNIACQSLGHLYESAGAFEPVGPPEGLRFVFASMCEG